MAVGWMARPREFDEATVLEAAMECFWARGYEATSVRDLALRMGITGASLYNAFGDKRALYRRSLDRYLDRSVRERIARVRELPPDQAIRAFFAEIVARSLADKRRRGCMLVNATLELAPQDAPFRKALAQALALIEAFFRDCVAAGQREGTITTARAADDLARHLLSVLLGLRVLARVRPERAVLEGAVSGALALLEGDDLRPAGRG